MGLNTNPTTDVGIILVPTNEYSQVKQKYLRI